MLDVKKIKKEMKAFPKFKVNVKTSGYNDVIKITPVETVTLKELQEVEAFASKYRQVDFDQVAGEILGGGNTFIQVYDNRSRIARWSSQTQL